MKTYEYTNILQEETEKKEKQPDTEISHLGKWNIEYLAPPPPGPYLYLAGPMLFHKIYVKTILVQQGAY